MTVVDEYRSEGREIGQAEGYVNGKVEVARNMLRRGLETALILELTCLSADQINQIKADMVA